MQPDQAADLVAGILTRNDVPFGSRDDGRAHRVLYGSTAVYIACNQWGDDDTVVSLAAAVLEQIPESARAQALERVNKLNCEGYFGKFCLYGDVIKLEHELLASHMQAAELMNALDIVVNRADENDDELKKEFGGKTWEDVEKESNSEEEALDT